MRVRMRAGVRVRMSISPSPISIGRIPQRTCVACRKVKAKRELIRLVRVADGGIEVDTSGKKTGRGVYLCQVEECWETGLKEGRLQHSLQTTLTENNQEQLIRHGKELFKESVSGKIR